VGESIPDHCGRQCGRGLVAGWLQQFAAKRCTAALISVAIAAFCAVRYQSWPGLAVIVLIPILFCFAAVAGLLGLDFHVEGLGDGMKAGVGAIDAAPASRRATTVSWRGNGILCFGAYPLVCCSAGFCFGHRSQCSSCPGETRTISVLAEVQRAIEQGYRESGRFPVPDPKGICRARRWNLGRYRGVRP